MGIGIAAAQILLELKNLGKFKDLKSVAEIGSQEIHFKKKDLEDLYLQSGLDPSNLSKYDNIDNWPKQPRASSKKFYEDLGFSDYSSIDINNEHGAIPLDLNYELKDKKLFNKFDVVTDFGSCEHIFNVSECYKTIHKILKVNGLIIIIQAVSGGNGFFLYDRSFLDGIVAANNYDILYSSYIVKTGTKTTSMSDKQFHIPLSKDLVNTLKSSQNLSICMVLRKKKDENFKIPYQGNLLLEKYNSYGFNRIYSKDDLSTSYIPQYEIEKISFKVLLKDFLRRFKKKLKI